MRTIKHEDVSVEIFDDIYEFQDAISSRPLNAVGNENRRTEGCEASQIVKQRKDQFYHTKTYLEAERLMDGGYHEGARAIANADTDFKGKSPLARSEANVIGHTPHIANYVIGHPLNMIRTFHPQETSKEVTIHFERSEACGVHADEIIDGVRKLVDAVKHIEDHNVRVTIYVSDWFCEERQKVAFMVRLKESDAKLNLMKMAYPLVHPSFHRRQGFRWLETSPIVTDIALADRYGYPFARYAGHDIESRRKYYLEHNLMRDKDVFIDSRTLRGCTDAKQVLDIIVKQARLNERN